MAGILVLDDDDALREFVRLVLMRAGHRVLEACDGRHALDMVLENPVDVVITDIYMPGADGLEVIQTMREYGCPCRILAVSGGGGLRNLDMLDHATSFGADAVLTKPIMADHLKDTVDRLLAMGPWKGDDDA